VEPETGEPETGVGASEHANVSMFEIPKPGFAPVRQ